MTQSSLPLAELGFSYGDQVYPYASVLVDCPHATDVFTYAIPPDLTVRDGDIVSVPFGKQQFGGLVIGCCDQLPETLAPERVKPIADVVMSGFFSEHYWHLLHWVAEYYCTDLITVVRIALPPGLLQQSQRRICLRSDRLPKDWALFLSQPSQRGARELIKLLQASKEHDYSYRYLKQKISPLPKATKDLLKRGWIESYLAPPKPMRPKQLLMVTLLTPPATSDPAELTPLQQSAVKVLQQRGGEMWLASLLKQVPCTLSTVKSLEKKGWVAIAEREQLRQGKLVSVAVSKPLAFTPAQAQAYENITTLKGFQQVLLHGVTGSGKTEVYLRISQDILQTGRSVLVLVPEIGLTPQLTDRFRARFGHKVAVYHSALGAGERYDTWRQTLLGNEQIIIGTRSAVFMPLPKLGLIILDEEHDSSFKQNQPAPCYHARTVAQRRAQLEQCPLVLGSATPSLESWQQAKTETGSETTHYLSLPERVQARPLPPVTIVDMRRELKRGNRSVFSGRLQQALRALKAQGQQGILFINRRGYSTFVSCRSCGEALECPHCDVSLSYHYTGQHRKILGGTPHPPDQEPLRPTLSHNQAPFRLEQSQLRCHYCNYTTLQPKFCPNCQSPYLKFFGSGTQKVTQALTAEFPELRWLRFDSDTTSRKGAHRQILEQFKQGEADLLVGTQMLTKGLDLAQVTLVGVMAADSLLNFADYRSAERGFQTLTQVSGRAGRGDEPGQVIIQTYTPQHPVIQAVQHHDYQQFIAQELPQRQALGYPPYGRLVLLRCLGYFPDLVANTIQAIAHYCSQHLPSQVELLGPAPASILRIAERYRWQLLLKSPASITVTMPVEALQVLCPAGIQLQIDVDPLSIN